MCDLTWNGPILISLNCKNLNVEGEVQFNKYLLTTHYTFTMLENQRFGEDGSVFFALRESFWAHQCLQI